MWGVGGEEGPAWKHEHTDRKAGRQPDPVGLVMGLDQLLPHVVYRHDEHGVGKGLVDDHQHNGHIPHSRRWQDVVHIACNKWQVQTESRSLDDSDNIGR